MMAGLLLAVALHADWHLARSHHHRLSFEWPYHWVATAAAFAIVGVVIARRWPAARWQTGTAALVIGIVLAQLVEPVVLEALIYDHMLAYHVEPARWAAFGQTVAAAVPAYALTLWGKARSAPSSAH